ncbi:hypothetical protein ABBQ38_007031 [Trebouxia sp. C0009 RCD-2024]
MRIRKLLLAYQLAHVQETRLRSYKRLMRAKPAIPMHVYFHLICLGTVWVRRYKSCRVASDKEPDSVIMLCVENCLHDYDTGSKSAVEKHRASELCGSQRSNQETR